MDKYGGSSVTVIDHEHVKKSAVIALSESKINHGNSILSFVVWCKIMRHKWSARGKTMIEWSFCDLFLNFETLHHIVFAIRQY